MEGIRANETVSRFSFPSFEQEIGEIERVGEHFSITSQNFASIFLERARASDLSALSEEQWQKVENTDSLDILKDDWSAVAHHAEHQYPPRDWKGLKQKLQIGSAVDGPIIAKRGEILHLVSGNTRLMVCRALGIYPEVLIIDISDIN